MKRLSAAANISSLTVATCATPRFGGGKKAISLNALS
jgi:hypothetical protein